MDTEKEGCAQRDITTLTMKFPEIDKYISKFEELARVAGYRAGRPETTQLFLNGLSPNILCNVMSPPVPTNYITAKERA